MMLLAMAALLAACPGGASTMITGRIVVKRAEGSAPVPDAQVRIWPLEPGSRAQKFESEAVQNLRGVALTKPNGGFEVGVLSSSATQTEYPLVKGWTYKIEVEVPGFYITSSSFEYAGGSQYVEMEIEEKTVDVLDTSGGVQEEEKELQRGSVRKSN
jgi:hypothetical protein